MDSSELVRFPMSSLPKCLADMQEYPNDTAGIVGDPESWIGRRLERNRRSAKTGVRLVD